MSTPAHVDSLMVELHRFGKAAGSIREGEKYIRTTGWDTPAVEVAMGLDEYDFLKNLNRLRYRSDVTDEAVQQAMNVLSDHASRMLPPLPDIPPQRLVQIDLVTGAAELWAFPFEASCSARVPRFADRQRPVVITRRIRGAFAERVVAWPARPRVLFVHAPVSDDLPGTLVDAHIGALENALGPWSRGAGSVPLDVKEAWGAHEFKAARDAAAQQQKPFTHIHVLAHGATIRDPEVPQLEQWGLRLGPPGTTAALPGELASALEPIDGLPVVVTVAACDSGNQTEAGMPTRSFAQELHLKGVPVVLASQLPLTTMGSTVLTRAFYAPLLQGEDVRLALHEARASLFDAAEAGHDWLSLVAYVRLPEGYADHLMEVGLRAELAMLDTAQRRADDLAASGGSEAEYDEVEALVRTRIASLTDRGTRLDRRQRGLAEECEGLLASGYKRLAEMLFERGRRSGRAADYREASRAALQSSLDHYRTAYRSNIHHHWSGIQQIALEAACSARVQNPADWSTVVRAAELDRDKAPEPGQPKGDYWACGSLAEAWLLAPIAGGERNLDAARDALALLRQRAPAGEAHPIASTRRQLNRYVSWWTNANGFFPGRGDLAEDATILLQSLA